MAPVLPTPKGTLPTMTTYICPRHPTVHVEMHIPAVVSCARCGKTLRRVEGPAAAMTPLFVLEKETPHVP